VQLEALALAFMGTAFITFTYRFFGTCRLPTALDVCGLAAHGDALDRGHSAVPAALRMKNAVRALRTAQGWSQSELGARLGVSRQTVNAIEAERYDPSLPLAFRIAAVFDRKIEEIFDAG
jgi:putative transcriptional regulator